MLLLPGLAGGGENGDQDSRRLSLRPYEDARVTAAGARVATVTRAACAVPLDASRPDGEDVIGPGLELEGRSGVASCAAIVGRVAAARLPTVIGLRPTATSTPHLDRHEEV